MKRLSQKDNLFYFRDMARVLAIDYGAKRTGLAVTDPSQIIASALTTVETKQLINFLNTYCSQEEVEAFVIGDSKTLNNEPSEIAAEIQAFAVKLQSIFPKKKLHWIDERFTSKMASHAIAQSGMSKKKKQAKGLIDEISATIILQSYLEQI